MLKEHFHKVVREYSKCHLPCKGQHKSLQTPSVSPQGIYTASCFPYAVEPIIKHRPHHRKWKNSDESFSYKYMYLYLYAVWDIRRMLDFFSRRSYFIFCKTKKKTKTRVHPFTLRTLYFQDDKAAWLKKNSWRYININILVTNRFTHFRPTHHHSYLWVRKESLTVNLTVIFKLTVILMAVQKYKIWAWAAKISKGIDFQISTYHAG